MPDLVDEDANFRGLKLVMEGANKAVLADPRIFKALRELAKYDKRRWGELEKMMSRYCAGHPLTDEQWNSEGRHRTGTGKEIGLHAFKPWQFRLYGFERDVGGKRCFVATGVDPDKKTNRADQEILRSAAKRAAPYID